jgi:hypothetical protein
LAGVRVPEVTDPSCYNRIYCVHEFLRAPAAGHNAIISLAVQDFGSLAGGIRVCRSWFQQAQPG